MSLVRRSPVETALTDVNHYSDVIMSTMTSQITSLTIVYPIIYSGAYQRKHQSSASLAFVRGIHRWPVNSLHKWPVTRKVFPFDNQVTRLLKGQIKSSTKKSQIRYKPWLGIYFGLFYFGYISRSNKNISKVFWNVSPPSGQWFS